MATQQKTRLPSIPQDAMIHEILGAIKNIRSKEDRISFLKKHNSLALRDVLRGAFDDSVVWIIPLGEPPYKKNSLAPGLSPNSLRSQSPKLAYFAKSGPGEKLLAVKREKMYIDLLESIHPNEAQLIVDMVNKNINHSTYHGITKELVVETFPGLIKK